MALTWYMFRHTRCQGCTPPEGQVSLTISPRHHSHASLRDMAGESEKPQYFAVGMCASRDTDPGLGT